MGLHTGEAIERDRNYFGSEVNRAARLMSLAHGGQVLVSDATEVLLRNRVALRPLGEHRLRGLRGRMSVYQVVADGLPAEFPVLRSVDDFAGNLPQQLSSLVGREQLVAEVAELVRSNRLVTLTGVGGVGKTRLALEVGAEVAGEFPDGVWMVELASVGDPASVPAAIATVLGITPAGRRAAHRHRRRRAAPAGELLLVVDNCEHVLAAAASAVDDDPRPVRDRQDPRHVTRDRSRVAGETVVHRRAARRRRRRDLRCRHAVRRPGPRRPARLRAPRAGDRRRGDRDLRDPRRAPARASSWRRPAWRR